jgi:hypothetical protein
MPDDDDTRAPQDALDVGCRVYERLGQRTRLVAIWCSAL